jgi:Dyp-type peroxidase family
VIEGFSHEFRGGMAQKSRARQLGDVEENAPKWWHWGGTPANEPHLVVMFFSEPGCYDALWQSATGPAWTEAFEIQRIPDVAELDPFEAFGFADGVSQPKVDWEQGRKPTHAEFDYTNIVALGEILLGYPNEYGKICDRPLLDPDATSADLLPADDAPGKKDLGRNGTYLVMRQLDQHVRKFWEFLHAQSGGNFAEAEKLATAMVGRTRAGDPLVPIQDAPIPGVGNDPEEVRMNQFTFDSDPAGARCPFGSHLRRANPRNADYPQRPASLLHKLITMLGFGPRGFRDDLMSPVRFHRILRRGRKYGERLDPENALSAPPAGDAPRGLYFICLNADISRQFEFLQNAWIAGTKFSGLTGESDPLLGTRQPIPGCPVTDTFTMQTENGLPRRVTGLPQFVTVRGGAYFFLPSLRAIRYIASVGEPAKG